MCPHLHPQPCTVSQQAQTCNNSMPCSRTLWELNLGNRNSQSVEQLAVVFTLTAERHSSFSFFQKTGCTPRIGRFLCAIFNLQFFVYTLTFCRLQAIFDVMPLILLKINIFFCIEHKMEERKLLMSKGLM